MILFDVRYGEGKVGSGGNGTDFLFTFYLGGCWDDDGGGGGNGILVFGIDSTSYLGMKY